MRANNSNKFSYTAKMPAVKSIYLSFRFFSNCNKTKDIMFV